MTVSRVFDRYLSILGIDTEPPSASHLRRLVRAQLIRVPFENISKLFRKKSLNATFIPNLEEHLDGIERTHFGGTCYANNTYFCMLLKHLGYNVSLSGADMSNPDVHVVSIVKLDGREYLVDVGYGAPFYEPLPRDLDHAYEIEYGRNRYVVHPRDAFGRSRMDAYRDGEVVHGYVAKPEAREIGHFEEAIRDSYREEATFMNTLLAVRFFEDKSVRFHNLMVSESTRSTTNTTRLADRGTLIESVVAQLEIPADIVREALAGIRLEATE